MIFLSGGALLVISSLGKVWPVESKNEYVGSDQCAVCHEPQFELWKNSLHSKMYQKSDQPGAILGDFSVDDPVRSFRRDEVAYTIGSRWEQMYVTRRNNEEFLLPAKWLIAQKKWATIDDTHRQNAPISKTCHGCHTTAYNPETNRFAEMNIGCEACHGPGLRHVQTRTPATIRKSQNPEVCGACHTRGKSKEGLDYVVKFDPQANRLIDMMAFTQPEKETTKSWWSNRIERDRHQEYLGYIRSRHARSLESLQQRAKLQPAEVTPKCFTCHSSEFHMAKPLKRPDVAGLRFGVTCVECHDPHGRKPERAQKRASTTENGLCLSCHFVPKVKGHLKEAHHYPCPKSAARCIDCHMPVTGLSASTFNIRSHTMQIIPPHEAQQLGMPSSCNNAGCHSNKDFGWLKRAYETYYSHKVMLRAR